MAGKKTDKRQPRATAADMAAADMAAADMAAPDMAELMRRHKCSVPYHYARALVMGCIASPAPDRSPMFAFRALWHGDMPPFGSLDEANEMLGGLTDELWNPLTEHQSPGKPFRLTPLRRLATKPGLRRHATVRLEEAGGFLDGFFGTHEDLAMPEPALEAVEAIKEIWSLLSGVADLLGRKGIAAEPAELEALSDNVKELEKILEGALNGAILICCHARRQMFSGKTGTGPTRTM